MHNLAYKKLIILCSSLLLTGVLMAATGNNKICVPDAAANPIPESAQEILDVPYQRRRQHEYEQIISQLETDGGVYNPALIPELISMGLQYQEEDQQRNAAETLQRALYLIRINDGLYSNKQLPLLDLMIKSNSAIQEWKKVADDYDHMRWLYARNYAHDDVRLLPALKRLRRWYLSAYNKETGRQLAQYYNVSQALYQQAINIIEKCSGDHQLALCFWHRACCAGAPPEYGTCPVDLPDLNNTDTVAQEPRE